MAKTPKRPRNVPAGARFVDPLWHYGSTDSNGAAQGLWCGWRKNGSLAFVANLRNDAVEGPSIEFHPDGGIYRRASQQGGKTVGFEELFAPSKKSDEAFPAQKPVARIVIDHAKRATKYFLEDGAESNEHGVPLSALVNDAPFIVRDSEAFARQNLAAYVKHRQKMAPSASSKAKAPASPGLTRDLAASWGVRPPAPLKVALSLLERAKIPKHLHDLRIDSLSSLASQGAGATAESIIGRGQRSPSGLPVVALLAGLVPFAEGPRENVFTLSLFDDDECAVYAWAESPRDLFLESDDFATFLLARAATEAHAAGMISSRARAHLAKLFAGHVRMQELGDVRWPPATFDDRETKTQQRHRRSGWLANLLSGKPLDIVLTTFEREDAAPLDRALAARLDRPDSLAPPDLIYALFRSHLASDPRLPLLLTAAEKSRSSLVASTAELVRSLEAGKNRIGAVREWPTIRRSLHHALFK